MEVENIKYDYQSIADVFRHIVGDHVMEAYAAVRDLYQILVILGMDHGVHAFFMPFRTMERKGKKKTRTV